MTDPIASKMFTQGTPTLASDDGLPPEGIKIEKSTIVHF